MKKYLIALIILLVACSPIQTSERVVRIGLDEDYAPVQYMDGSEIVGIFPDIIDWMSDNSNLSFEYVIYKNFNDMIDDLKNNKLDAVSAVASIEERRAFAYFTDFTYDIESVALTRNSMDFSDEADLMKSNVALIEGFTVSSKVEKRYPDKEFVYVSTVDEGIKGLSVGNYDAFICELAQASYYVDDLNVVNLKVLHNINLDISTDLAFMIDDDQGDLLKDFNMILNNMPDQVKEDIEGEWVSLTRNEWTIWFNVITLSLAVIAVIALFIVIWNRSLKKEVNKKTDELTGALNKNKDQQKLLKEMNDSLEQTVEERTRELLGVNEALEKSIQSLKDTQVELVEARKIASLGSLVTALSHELNTPVGSSLISNSAIHSELKVLSRLLESDQLSRGKLGKSFDKMQSLCDLNESGLNKVKAIIDDFKEISIKKGERSFRQVKLSDAVALSYHQVFKDMSLEIEYDFEMSLSLKSNLELLVLVFSNLMKNSLNYAVLDLGYIKISALKDDETCIIKYYDSSLVIKPEIVSQMFEPFHTSDRGGHMGLGLYKVYNIIHYTLGGKIYYVGDQKPHFEIKFPVSND
ncbi:transporter substrate-binding domain-containing protein [Acidaminobacter sp. JC074]|uniref:transporter substrate-binding domain-containing protein n=1 Tax=Acidaminobacter sp. JC074 TaxID=2530199 RepID=UPI001F0D01BF|nr:transporter substrate-binding domain-containing protein [Acidaminobacter sp. JC074]MCH4891126.1 transporter substrate-binding domain-containing protein [Acidaminobacter sp. JC074]